MQFLPLLALLPAALANPLNVRATACNNSPDLCDKSYGDITHLGAHDSPFVTSSSSSMALAANQYYDTPTQLSAGVRLVSGQVHKDNSQWRLCHTSCNLLDAGKLSDWLSDIKDWLDDNPNEVVTLLLVNSDTASASDLNTEFEAANITSYGYEPSSQTSAPSSWPTLQKMIDSGKRLVVFVPDLKTDTSYPYLLNEWDFVWENAYDVRSASNFSCDADRPSTDTTTLAASNKLPLLNHFLYSSDLSDLGIEYPNSSYVATTNAASGGIGNLGTAASKCKKQWNRAPAFILVDFFNRGPAIDAVDDLNGVTNAVGRTSVSTAAGSSSDASTINNVFKGLVELASSAKAGATPSMGNWVWVGGDWNSILGGGISLS